MIKFILVSFSFFLAFHLDLSAQTNRNGEIDSTDNYFHNLYDNNSDTVYLIRYSELDSAFSEIIVRVKGNVRYIVENKNGLKNGMERVYSEKNRLTKLRFHHDDSLTYHSRYGKGKLRYECSYKLGTKDGVERTYFRNGKLKYELNYSLGLLDGPEIRYRKSGRVILKWIWKDDVLVDVF